MTNIMLVFLSLKVAFDLIFGFWAFLQARFHMNQLDDIMEREKYLATIVNALMHRPEKCGMAVKTTSFILRIEWGCRRLSESAI
jgi:hypothetical protein